MLGKIPFLQIVEQSVVCSPAKNITNDLSQIDEEMIVLMWTCSLKKRLCSFAEHGLKVVGVFRMWSEELPATSYMMLLEWILLLYICSWIVVAALYLFIYFMAPLARLQYNIKFHRMLISTCPNLVIYLVPMLLARYWFFFFFLSEFVQANMETSSFFS